MPNEDNPLKISLNFHLRHSTTQEVVLPRIPFCFPNEYKNYSHVKLGTGKPRQQKEVKPDHAYAIAKAEELQDELGSDYPTFVKPMPQSLTSLVKLKLPLIYCTERGLIVRY